VTLEAGAELPVRTELLFGENAGRAEEPVDEGRGMTLREDEPVVRRALRVVVVVAEVAREQHRREVCGRHRRRRVSGSGLRARTDRVDAKLLPELPVEVVVSHAQVP
jgi:hypothetical protein